MRANRCYPAGQLASRQEGSALCQIQLHQGVVVEEFEPIETSHRLINLSPMYVLEVPDDEFGTLPMHAVVPRFSRTPGSIRRLAPRLNEHSEEIRAELALRARQGSQPHAVEG